MKTALIIGGSLAVVGVATYFIVKSAKSGNEQTQVATSTTTSTTTKHGGVVSSLKGVLDGLKVSLA